MFFYPSKTMLFRLRTIFALIGIASLACASIASHWHSRSEFGSCVLDVVEAMKIANTEVESTLTARLLANPHIKGQLRQMAASAIRKDLQVGSTQDGSLLSGKGYVHEFVIQFSTRDIDPASPAYSLLYSKDLPRVSVVLRCETDWAIFSRGPSVTISHSKLSMDEEYLKAFMEVLDSQYNVKIIGG